MPRRLFVSFVSVIFTLSCFVARAQGQGGASPTVPASSVPAADADHEEQRSAWFLRGRVIPGKNSAELRRRAFQAKLQNRSARRAAAGGLIKGTAGGAAGTAAPAQTADEWQPLGPVPLASDASGNGTQDYHQVSGRATAVAIDPADPSGNTVFIGGAQGGVWQSANAASSSASSVTWAPLTDDQATLSVGSIAIQPGNSNPATSLVLVGTGEADNSADSYFGLGILRSPDGGNNWALIPTANGGTLSFSGLGGTRMAFSTANTNTVVSAMATSSEAVEAGAITASTKRGLYTSLDAGQSWTYNALLDGNQATDATSSTSVAYNSAAGMFLAAVRYHGFYSSPDGITWTRLATQPGSSLSTTACPPQSTANQQSCPIYRAEITVVPGRKEMYAWYISLDSSGQPVDGGIWQSLNGGATWIRISDAGITNCGDDSGCGVEQGYYNLELLAVPNGSVTDLYAGAINLYKCSINSANPTCNTNPFINLTHVYGCMPIAAPAHVHPDQHALAYMIPGTGGDSGNDLMYFANDGGIYRALDGYSGLTSGLCSGSNAFDDLNQNLGSMTQFVSFSQHPSDPNTLLGGTQDNGSPATSSATTSMSWINVNGGDGGYSAIDPNTPLNFFVSNPDIPPEGLSIQECPGGVNCREGSFNAIVGSADVGGDDGAFYFPYVLDPQSASALLLGTCRLWRGPRLGGSYALLSPNFDTLGTGTCSGSEINLVRAVAAGGPTDSNGSMVIYTTTDGLGPINGPLNSPSGGNVWVTSNATAGASAFTEVTQTINPNQFPISSVAIDSSDSTGKTAYVTVMGFTGGTGHVWQTTNGGVTWTDFTGTGVNALPDAPVNAVVVDPGTAVYVGTDVGVFQSSITSPAWTELGPVPNPQGGSTGFLPNVAVTALAIFNAGQQKLLRASTYGRGLWQFDINTTQDFQISIANSPQTSFAGQPVTYSGTLYSVDGYSNTVTLTCIAGATNPPPTCTPPSSLLIPTAAGVPLTVTATGPAGDYSFNLQGSGSDSNVVHTVALVLHEISFGISAPSPASLTVLDGTTSSPVSFQVTAVSVFNQSVTVSCTVPIAGATCNLTPGTVVNPTSSNPVNMTASVVVPSGTTATSYTVILQASTSGTTPVSTSFTLTVLSNPDYILSEVGTFPVVNSGGSATGTISVTAQDGFGGTVFLNCSLSSGNGSCSVSPTSVGTYPASATVTVNGTNLAAGSYQASVQGVFGTTTHTLVIPFNVGDYQLSGSSSLTIPPGGQGTASLTITASQYYAGLVNASCDASVLPGTICTVSPASPVAVNAGAQVPLTATFSVPNPATPGTYNININTHDTTGAPSHSFMIALIIPPPDFKLGEPGSFPTVNAGSSTTSGPIGVSALNGFAGTVSLTCSLASGNGSCGVAPTSVSSYPASAAVTINASALAAGSYQALVQGVSGPLTHTLAIPFNVGDYQLSGTSSLTIPPGGQSTVGLTITASTYYAGSVIVSCDASALPGTICTLSPANPVTINAGSQVPLTATIDVSNVAAPGTYNLKVNTQDTTGAPTHSSMIALTVPPPDFKLTEQGTFPTVNAGSSTTSGAIGVSALNGFTATVSFTCSLASGNGGCSVAPTSVNSYPASATVTINASALAAGSYQALVQGVSGALTHTLAIPFNVGDYQLSGPQSLSLVQRATGAVGLTIAASPYYSGMVTATCDASALAGTICTTSPATPTNPIAVTASGSVPLTVTISVTNDATPNTYNIKINTQDTTGAPSHSFTIALTVFADFDISASPSSQSVIAGNQASYNLTVLPVGSSFNNAVKLSCSSQPAGAGCTFNPANTVQPPIVAGGQNVVMTVSVSSSSGTRRPTQQTPLFYLLGLTMPAIVVLLGTVGSSKESCRSRCSSRIGPVLLLPLAAVLLSCAGGTGISSGACGAIPSVPTGLAASSTTSSGTTLNWSPSSAISGCSVSSYTVYEGTGTLNPSPIGNPTNTNFLVSNLLPSTTYNFEVAASDSAGISSPSPGITVQTSPGTPYLVTVTGVSGSLSHNATVTLIVGR